MTNTFRGFPRRIARFTRLSLLVGSTRRRSRINRNRRVDRRRKKNSSIRWLLLAARKRKRTTRCTPRRWRRGTNPHSRWQKSLSTLTLLMGRLRWQIARGKNPLLSSCLMNRLSNRTCMTLPGLIVSPLRYGRLHLIQVRGPMGGRLLIRKRWRLRKLLLVRLRSWNQRIGLDPARCVASANSKRNSSPLPTSHSTPPHHSRVAT